MFKRTLIMAGLLVFVAGTLFADDAPVKIVKPQGKAPRAAAGTGLQGTIAVSGEAAALSCGDLTVHVGILHANAATLTSFASAKASGTSGQCTYSVTGLPAGGPFDVVVVPDASKSCKLSNERSFGQVTFKRGALSTLDVQLTPVCEQK